jgi:uncharacterized protein YndB with AHSA1/START domain
MPSVRNTNSAPVRKEVTVPVPPERAFQAFTDGMNDWWSRAHAWGKTPLERQVLEPREQGRWCALFEDGTSRDYGRVTLCEPGHRIVIACFQLTDYEHAPDPKYETEIEVTFTAVAAGTLVRLEHRMLERYGAEVWEVRGHLDAVVGWRATLDDFAKSLASDQVTPA